MIVKQFELICWVGKKTVDNFSDGIDVKNFCLIFYKYSSDEIAPVVWDVPDK